jgi:hypothetical protein
MRITLNVDADLLEAAKRLAASNAQTVSEVICELARRGLESPPPRTRVSGVPVFDVPANGKPLSLGEIRREDSEW